MTAIASTIMTRIVLGGTTAVILRDAIVRMTITRRDTIVGMTMTRGDQVVGAGKTIQIMVVGHQVVGNHMVISAITRVITGIVVITGDEIIEYGLREFVMRLAARGRDHDRAYVEAQ